MKRALILLVAIITLLAGMVSLQLSGDAPALAGPSLQESGTPAATPTYPFEGTYTPPAEPPALPIPPPVPMIDVDNSAIVNVLLLGSDSPDYYYRRTDVMILVTIHKDAGTAALWHIPRATWVYIPNHTMDLINTVFARGAGGGATPADGFALLQETFRYNFGIELDHYARVNYEGFLKLIEALGGLDITVDCALEDWRLIEPELDPGLEENWEKYTLGIGQRHLSPYMSLWYVRSRHSTSDLDRGRRQMDVLRAIWQQVRTMGLLTQIDILWPQITSIVETNMEFTDVLDLLPLATTLNIAQVARYGGDLDVHYTQVYTPDNGREVLVPNREYLMPMIEDLLTPATSNRLSPATVTVDVADASWYAAGYALVAADRLAWEGFYARPLDSIGDIQREWTIIYDYTGQTKSSVLPDLQRILRVGESQIVRQPNPNRAVDYRVEIGTEYRSCVYSFAEDELSGEPGDALETGALSETEVRISPCWLRFRAEVNVRSGPGTEYEALDTATPNNHFPVIGRSEDGAWWQVDDDGEIGWVSGEITTVDSVGDCRAVPVPGTEEEPAFGVE